MKHQLDPINHHLYRLITENPFLPSAGTHLRTHSLTLGFCN